MVLLPPGNLAVGFTPRGLPPCRFSPPAAIRNEASFVSRGGWLCVAVRFTSRQQSPGNDRQFASRRHHGHIVTLAAFQTLEEMAQRTCLS